MGQLDTTKLCPHCGSAMVLVLQPGGKGPRTLKCLDCERFDPLRAGTATGWFRGELQPPK
jgi:hypothetical protein